MLEVQTSQILDLILPEFRRFLALAAPGGDADGGFARHLNPFAKKRKPPVAYWSGIVDVGPAGRQFRYTVPDYFNGKLRVVAIAVNRGASVPPMAATEVKGDFILTPNVPAMVAPGDEFTVSVGVFNNTTGGQRPDSSGGAGAAPGCRPRVRPRSISRFRTRRKPSASSASRRTPCSGSADLKFVARRGGPKRGSKRA